jgi:hypothetical protein
MALKQFRNWFFQATGIPGTRFLKHNKPTENVIRDFLASIGFFKEVSDTASTTQQGFVKKSTNAQIVSRSASDGDGFTLGVTPAQLPKVTLNGSAITPTQDISGAQTYDVIAATPTTVSQNGTAITPVAGNYNVNTWLEYMSWSKNPVNQILKHNSNTFNAANSSVVSNSLTPGINLLPTGETTAFSYNSSTGVITFLKKGLYNIDCWIHFGEDSSPSHWIQINEEDYQSAHFLAGLISNTGNFMAATSSVFYVNDISIGGIPATATAPPFNQQHYVDLNLSAKAVYRGVGDTVQVIVQNNTAAASNGTDGLITLSIQYIASMA